VDRDHVLRRLGDDDLWAKRDELAHERRDPFRSTLRVTILDLKILAHDIAAIAQSLQKRLLILCVLGRRDKSDAMNRLLSPGLRRKQDPARRDRGEYAVPPHGSPRLN